MDVVFRGECLVMRGVGRNFPPVKKFYTRAGACWHSSRILIASRCDDLVGQTYWFGEKRFVAARHLD
jgi:hypothetical protein